MACLSISRLNPGSFSIKDDFPAGSSGQFCQVILRPFLGHNDGPMQVGMNQVIMADRQPKILTSLLMSSIHIGMTGNDFSQKLESLSQHIHIRIAPLVMTPKFQALCECYSPRPSSRLSGLNPGPESH